MKKLLITGATSGLAIAILKDIPDSYCRVYLTARSSLTLEKLASKDPSRFIAIGADLCNDEDLDELLVKVSDVDHVIHCAGIGNAGNFLNIELSEHLKTLKVNCEATLKINYTLAKKMVERKKGTILNISSFCAFVPISKMNTYSASKSFMNFLGQALAHELKGTGVNIITYCPGGINSTFHKKAGLSDRIISDNKMFLLEPDAIAKEVLDLLNKDSQTVIPGNINKILYLLVKVLPQSWHIKNISNFYKKYIRD